MDGRTTDLRGDMYDMIFKTIYLFLETNEFYTTAKCFLSEIKTKYNREVDKTLSNARTLVLRPYYERADAATVYDTPRDGAEKDSASEFDFDKEFTVERLVLSRQSLDDDAARTRPSEMKVEVLTAKSERTSLNRSEATKHDAASCEPSPERLDSHGTIERIRRDLEYVNEMAVKEQPLDGHDLSLLRESFRLLQTIQGNHVKLINLAKSLSSAILKLDLPSKEHFLTYYHKDIAELCSYGKRAAPPPPPPSPPEEERLPTDVDDPTEYQIESSAIDSSIASNHLLAGGRELFIPLESKPVVGDIAALKTSASRVEIIKPFDTAATSSLSEAHASTACLTPPRRFRDVCRRRANKSATLPSVHVGGGGGGSGGGGGAAKSRSASQLDAMPRSDARVEPDCVRGTQRLDLERQYQSLIREKTKLILEREKTRLEEEIKKINRVNRAALTREKLKTSRGARNATEPAERAASSQHSDAAWRASANRPTDLCAADAERARSEHQFEMDWCALKRALFDETPELKMKILQALRWRLLYAEERHRYKFLMDYVKNDVLSINTVAPYGQLFLESFYCPKKMATPHPLQEEMSRFINTLASLAMGRFYLERDESLLSVMLLPLLMGKLPGVQIGELTRQFIVAAVQKLSLSNKMRECIIATGAVEWLITFIASHHARLTAYEAEYSTALLTNLCINKAGRDRCERVADGVVSVVDELVVTPHKCCLPYINPILHNLLLNPVVNERAFARGLGARLQRLHVIYGDDDDLKRQLDAIVAMQERREFCDCDDAETEETSCQNYADFLEQELAQDDPVYRTPFGEALLKAFALRDCAPSSASLRTFCHNDGKRPAIVQKHCNCNCRYERRHLAAQPASAVETTTPFVNRSGPAKKAKKPTRHQRSFSQPPATQRQTLPPEGARDASKAAALLAKRARETPHRKYIVNCCYKMDYVNATAAPPGEFLPSALRASSPHLRLCDGDERACECYEAMRGFLAECAEEAAALKPAASKSSTGLHASSLFRRQSSDSRSLVDLNRSSSLNASLARAPAVDCKASSLFDMKNFTDDDDKVISYEDRLDGGGASGVSAASMAKSNASSKIKVADYRVVNDVDGFDGAESPTTGAAILKLYDVPKLTNKR